MTKMPRFFIVAALMILIHVPNSAFSHANNCEENSDCRIVTSYEAPEGGRPAKTLIDCRPTADAVKEGEWLAEYNDYTNSTCVCLETKSCGFKR